MAEIINLRQARKARLRVEKDEKAADNRIAFGRPKKARTLQERKTAIEVARHEGHKLVGPDSET
ncbi:DUF4169 family protein [Methylobacterium sp. E-041]|jgi:hypothetical protein|uniref:DUF4169 family protein n=1 Tax=Methylobacterium sp. E-041 TaxID=2836573 RepID=UPI001FBA8D66|nr:DUF4169 family protein [Methylobacterium sp. E-041]MCJ2108952.1 DUF4169 family protein [Methylobacterium sp. E-041]